MPPSRQEYLYDNELPPITTREGRERILSDVENFRPDFMIVDTFAMATGGKVDGNKAKEMTEILRWLKDIARATDTAICLVHHFTKKVTGNLLIDLRGSSGISATVDNIFGLYAKKGEDTGVLKFLGKDLEAGEIPLVFNDGVWEPKRIDGMLVEVPLTTIEGETFRVVQEIFREKGRCTMKDVSEARQVSPMDVGEGTAWRYPY